MKEQKEKEPIRSQLDIKSYQGSGLNSELSIINEFHDLVQGVEIILSDGKRKLIKMAGVLSTAYKSYFPGPGSASTPERPHPGAKTYAGMEKRIGRGILKSEFAQDFNGAAFEKIYDFPLHRTISGVARGGGRHENALASATMVADMQAQLDVFLVKVEEAPVKGDIHPFYQGYAPLIISCGKDIWVYWRDLNGEMQLDQSDKPKLYEKLSFKYQIKNLEGALPKPLKPTTILNETYNFLDREDSESSSEEKFCYKGIVLFSGEFKLENCKEGMLYFEVSNGKAVAYSAESKEPIELDSLEYANLSKVFKGRIEKILSPGKAIRITESSPLIEVALTSIYKNACKRKSAEKAAEPIYKNLADIRNEAVAAPLSTKYLRVGWSRGGITALHEVNLLHELGFLGKKLLFLIDPVAGNGVGDVESIIRRLPPNTKAKIILTKGDRTQEFEPQDKQRITAENGVEIEFIVVNGTHSQVAGGTVENPDNFNCIPADITRYHLHKFLREELTKDEFDEAIGKGTRTWNISDEKMIENYAQTEVELDKFRYTLNPLATPMDAAYTPKIRDFAQELHGYVRKPEYFVNDHHEELFKKQYPELYYKYVYIADEKAPVPEKYKSFAGESPAPLASIEELGTRIDSYSKKLLIAGILLRDIDGRIRDIYNKEEKYAKNPQKRASCGALRAFKLSLMELRESAAKSIFSQLDQLPKSDNLEESKSEKSVSYVLRPTITIDAEIGEEGGSQLTSVEESISRDSSVEDVGEVREVLEDSDEILVDEDPKSSSISKEREKSETVHSLKELEALPLVEQCRRAAQMTTGVLDESQNSLHKRTYVAEFSRVIKKPESESIGRKIVEAALQVISICMLGPQALYGTLKYVTSFFKPAVVTQQESVTLTAKSVIKAQARESNPTKPFYRGLSLGRR